MLISNGARAEHVDWILARLQQLDPCAFYDSDAGNFFVFCTAQPGRLALQFAIAIDQTNPKPSQPEAMLVAVADIVEKLQGMTIAQGRAVLNFARDCWIEHHQAELAEAARAVGEELDRTFPIPRLDEMEGEHE